MASLRDYAALLGEEVTNEILELGDRLAGLRVIHVNSTRVGGGVAEILERLIPLLREAKIDAEWRVIEGDEQFFRITKRMHNALHGAPLDLDEASIAHYLAINEQNAAALADLPDADLVVIHDPQPLALIRSFPKRHGKWIWRCHIDVSTPHASVWRFLEGFVTQYDATVFHVEQFARRGLRVRQFVIPPAIDPLSPKNCPLTSEEVTHVLQELHVNVEKPIIAQIGRFDRLKDPEGVVRLFLDLQRAPDAAAAGGSPGGGNPTAVASSGGGPLNAQLLLVGTLAPDDPEGQEVYAAVMDLARGTPDVHAVALPPDSHHEINAIQRASAVVLQKSLKEGFGLTVSEALWKGKAVVGGNTGGIPLQVIDGVNGYLVNTLTEAGDRVRFLLEHPARAYQMGLQGHEHVLQNFLITRYLRDHLLLYLTLRLIPRKLVQL